MSIGVEVLTLGGLASNHTAGTTRPVDCPYGAPGGGPKPATRATRDYDCASVLDRLGLLLGGFTVLHTHGV